MPAAVTEVCYPIDDCPAHPRTGVEAGHEVGGGWECGEGSQTDRQQNGFSPFLFWSLAACSLRIFTTIESSFSLLTK